MMDPERWRQIDSLLQEALDREPAEWPEFLEDACVDDPSLKSEVESLLSSGDRTVSFIDSPAFELAAGLLSTHIPELSAGQLVGSYRILSFLGAGGMGEVYLAQDTELGRQIALKLLPAEFTKARDRVDRFQREARAASALNHPNILTIHQIGRSDDQHFIATEFVDGETIRGYLKHATPDLREVLDIAIQLAGALAAAHQAGIVHRDLKPENIMIRRDGYVKVLDFGLAKLKEQDAHVSASQVAGKPDISSDLLMGTVRYMSPEQACNLPVDRRSDIFSFGVLLYEMLTRHAPFKGEASKEVIISILKDEPAPITRFLPDAPVDLQEIVSKALKKDEAKRFQSAEDLLFDLRALRQRLELKSPLETTGPIADDDNLSPDDKQTARVSIVENVISHINQHRTATAFGMIALLAGVGITIYSLRTLISKPRISFANAEGRKVPGIANLRGSAAISPDGKLVAYRVSEQSESSIWLRVADGAGTPKQVAQGGNANFYGVVFSGDGKSLFFNRQENGSSALYRIQIDGSDPPLKLLEQVDSRITLSPDDKQLAFIRQYPNEGESVLVVANVDGTQERRIAVSKEPYFYPANGPAWSPDGRSIVAIVEGGSANASALIAFDVNSGVESKIGTLAAWPRFRDVAWLPDGSGLVLIVTEGGPTSPSEVWQLSYPDWQPSQITNTKKFYESISLSKSSGTLLAVERETRSDIWISSVTGESEPTQITRTLASGRGGLCWTPDKRIVYHSRERGTDSLERMNADGRNQQNLTPGSDGNFYPSVSADGRSVIFMSRRTGALHIWRLDNETGQQVQLTGGSDEQFPQVTADGSRVYYNSWESGTGTVWHVPINGGHASQVITENSLHPELSPDGTLLSYVTYENRTTLRKIVSLKNARTIRTFSGPLAQLQIVHWSRAGDALLYLDQRQGAWNVWSQPLSGGEPKQLTHFTEGRIYFFDESWDGKSLVLSRGSESSSLVIFSAR